MAIIEYILYGIVGLFCLYLAFRLISIAVFKSWIEAKKQNNKGRKDDGINKID